MVSGVLLLLLTVIRDNHGVVVIIDFNDISGVRFA